MSIRRNSPCPCGSGKKYKQCCGAISGGASDDPVSEFLNPKNGRFLKSLAEQDMQQKFLSDMPAGHTNGDKAVPPGFILLYDFIPEEDLVELRRYAQEGEGSDAGVQDVSNSDDAQIASKMNANRVTEHVDVTPVYEEVWELVVRAYQVTGDYFDRGIEWIEPPGILRYPPGGTYRSHADDSAWDTVSRQWVRTIDRDFSLLIYLNDDFEGGAIYFNNFDLRIQPKAGMLVAFPSDYRYLHTAEKVISGERYAIVSWSAADDKPKIRTPPQGSVVIKELEEFLEEQGKL